MVPVTSASIVTIGNELVSGDVPNTNGSWLARRVAKRGVSVRLIATVPDELGRIANLVRNEAAAADHVLVTGGLGGTPDDITREAVAAAFAVEQRTDPEVAERLRSRFASDPDYVARWAELPAGSRPLENPLGGAPGFVIRNVFVLPGLPAEMEAMYETIAGELGTGVPIASWRRTYRTRESRIAPVLEHATVRHPRVLVGSYPEFGADGPTVEVVLKCPDADALAAAAAWIEPELERVAS